MAGLPGREQGVLSPVGSPLPLPFDQVERQIFKDGLLMPMKYLFVLEMKALENYYLSRSTCMAQDVFPKHEAEWRVVAVKSNPGWG
jgi:hypothetical protein